MTRPDAASGGLTRLVVPAAGDGERLDRFLAAATGLSRRRCRELVGAGEVWRNGRSLRVQSRTLEAGDVVDVLQPPAALGLDAAPAVQRPTFLHLDRALAVVDKPAGVLSQPAEARDPQDRALDEIVLLALAHQTGQRPFLRLIHRLDRLTSGAVLFARTPQALPKLAAAWRDGAVERRYVAVVEGHPAWTSELVDRPIARDPGHQWRFRVDPDGRPARTEVTLTAVTADGLAVVECRLLTGRTHQVRVHLAALGHPVLGDRLYGSRRAAEAPRPLLHAALLALPHPDNGERLVVSSPWPADLAVHRPPAPDPQTDSDSRL